MKAQRPYLLRALYEWIVDSDEVPYLLVDATVHGVQVPLEHVQDGQIVLNVGPNAVRDMVMADDYVMCGGRFSGRHFDIYLPMASVRAIYGKDTQHGMVFPEESFGPVDADDKTVKGDLAIAPASHNAEHQPATASPGRLDLTAEESADVSEGSENATDKAAADGKPNLRLV